ncbi:MSHA biogenesis protein MshO [Oceanisphaera litoralis]|uniref:PilW family protein n=1 Tax=Oceanisphaera litoralis TaxID=225144 RepID=UPI00195BD2A5|nr:type II secretion system protein [Oceanisphaera litoralis]MBM7454758.1 MSHA biogenesis protein MshO [Oceanisphaera litoralis]
MKARGFTLIELVIVLALIGISAIFGTRFIADMATAYVGTAERGQALAGARFAMERIKRELSLAYSPSVYVSANEDGIDNRCVSFVPVLASGRYNGRVTDLNPDATFIIPLIQQGNAIEKVNLTVRADSGEAVWQDYPGTRPMNVVEFGYKKPEEEVKLPASLPFADAFRFSAGEVSFGREGLGKRYVLLQRRQVRFCLQHGALWRYENTGSGWSPAVLMLNNVVSNRVFSDYNESLQLLVMSLSLQTRDGELVLPSQIQVIYEP